MTPITLNINGRARAVLVAPLQTLLAVLRNDLGLTGAKQGCNQGYCGACTVLRDAAPVRACLTLAEACVGANITTIEGLAPAGTLAPVQQAFAASHAVQCGFCTSGMILAAHALLQNCPNPSRAEVRAGLVGNLCRCSGYAKIVDAVCAAGKLLTP